MDVEEDGIKQAQKKTEKTPMAHLTENQAHIKEERKNGLNTSVL